MKKEIQAYAHKVQFLKKSNFVEERPKRLFYSSLKKMKTLSKKNKESFKVLSYNKILEILYEYYMYDDIICK